MDIKTLRIQLRRLIYHLRHEYMTLNNVVITIALVVAAGWAWGSVSAMQRNLSLQRNLEDLKQQQKLAQLEVETEQYQTAYYKSPEYQELTAREHYGLALPGEKLLVLPPNSAAAEQVQAQTTTQAQPSDKQSNFQQWMNFLSGDNAKRLQ